MKIESNSFVKSVEVQAVIHRADGRIEPVGTIAYWHRNPTMRCWHEIKSNLVRLNQLVRTWL